MTLAHDFNIYGHFKVTEFIGDVAIHQLKDQIEEILRNKNFGDFYYDRNGLPRRLENVVDSGGPIAELNLKIIQFLKMALNREYLIFKDKINFKPPGGEGFYAHYDGIFMFKDAAGNLKPGWHEYADEFISVLIPLDDFDLSNGCLEVADIHDEPFDVLLAKTKGDGTPDLIGSEEERCVFKPILMRKGGLLAFSHKCPHRSKRNDSLISRQSLYFTYNPAVFGYKYNDYFKDKHQSQNNTSKSLSGEM